MGEQMIGFLTLSTPYAPARRQGALGILFFFFFSVACHCSDFPEQPQM